MKTKYFAQPDFKVVRMNNKDIVTISGLGFGEVLDSNQSYEASTSGRRFDSWYEGD